MIIEEYNRNLFITMNGRCDCGKFDNGKRHCIGIVCDNCGIEVKRIKRIAFNKQEFFKELNDRKVIKYPTKNI